MIPVLLLLAAIPGQPEENEIAIFTAPIPIAGAVGLSLLENRNPMLYVPVGINFTAGDVEWSADAAFVLLAPRGTPRLGGFTGFWFAFGPVIHAGARPLRGLFFTPKITIGGFRVNTGETTVDFLVGADFGYQVTVGRVYAALVIGASFGAGWNENDDVAGPWLNVAVPLKTGQGPVLVYGVNLDVLRLGFTF